MPALPGLAKPVEATLFDANGNAIFSSTSVPGIVAMLAGGSIVDGEGNTSRMLTTAGGGASPAVLPLVFNGSTFDRMRGNVESTILTSASRTTTQTGSDRTNYNSAGLLLFVSITIIGTGSITPSLQIKDSVSGDYKTIWAAAAALIANGDAAYVFYPGAATLGTFTEALQMRPPRTYRWVVTANNASAVTYSAGEVQLM